MKLTGTTILVAAFGLASAAAITAPDFEHSGAALTDYLEHTEPQHHDTALNARSEELTPAELTARAALDSLVESVSLVQRSPEDFLTTLVDNKAKREAAPWCERNRGAGCWKYKRDVADSEAALLEQRSCLAEGGLCAHVRRAAEAVLGPLKSVEARDSDLAIVARNVLDSLQVNY